jgi:hypothetical protein
MSLHLLAINDKLQPFIYVCQHNVYARFMYIQVTYCRTVYAVETAEQALINYMSQLLPKHIREASSKNKKLLCEPALQFVRHHEHR